MNLHHFTTPNLFFYKMTNICPLMQDKTLRQKSTESELFKPLREGTSVVTPKWLTFDAPNHHD